jgi:hypothetical protein
MNLWSAQVYNRDFEDKDERILSLFSALPTSAAEFDLALAAQLSGQMTFDAIHIVGYQGAIELVSGWLNQDGNVSLERLINSVGEVSKRIKLIYFDTETGLHTSRNLSGAKSNDAHLISTEQTKSLLSAFRQSGGEERAPFGTHYSKTSDRHSDRFLRVSNVVENAANVQLIAFWLMPRIWKGSWKQILVDTSSIYSVALTATHEAMLMQGLVERPGIWSFRSYAGISEISDQQAKQSLFLISASTSNGLVEKLKSRGVDNESIVTLFHLEDELTPNAQVLCNLKGVNGDGIEVIQNYAADGCELCNKHHHLIRIDGDQFSISPPNINSIEILAKDLPSDYKSNLSALAGLGAFYAYRRQGERIATLGIDVKPILIGDISDKSRALLTKKRERWEVQKRLSMTVSLRSIISSSHPGSQEIAEAIAIDIRQSLSIPGQISVLSPSELRAIDPLPNSGAVVSISCIDDGKELLAISRTLRKVQPGGSIRYLCPVMLLGPKRESGRLTSNLTFGSHGKDTFQLEPLFQFDVECYELETSWAQELSSLRKLVDWADSKEEEIPDEIEARISRLQKAPADGLRDDLFWPSMNGEPLQLRSDFTLLDDSLRSPAASQADLFAVYCVVLTSLRHNDTSNRRLQNNSFVRSVIAPSNFDRFSDGVLQACLLRTARPKELSYGTCEMETSEEMKNVLLFALSTQGDTDKAEATLEFLVALMTGRMSLRGSHLREVTDAVINTTGKTGRTAFLMAKYIQDKHFS